MKKNNIKISKKSKAVNWHDFQIVLFILILPVFIFASCKSDNEESTKKQKTKNPPLVKVEPAQKTKMVSTIDITGTIEPNVFTYINASANGTIDSLAVRENQQVKKNQIIAVINPTDRESLISENRLKVQQIEETLKTTDSDSEEYKALSEQLKAAKNNLEYAKNIYQTISIVSPMHGLITERYPDEGSQVKTGERIVKISDMQSLVIKANVNERYFSAINEEKRLQVILNAYPNDTLTGRISLIYPQIDSETRSVNFDVKILNFNKKLLPGMMASIKIPVSQKENAVVALEHAILSSPDDKEFIFIIDDNNIAHQRYVQTGIASGRDVEIVQGLQQGEKIVVSGQEVLNDGMKVSIMK